MLAIKNPQYLSYHHETLVMLVENQIDWLKKLYFVLIVQFFINQFLLVQSKDNFHHSLRTIQIGIDYHKDKLKRTHPCTCK